MSDRGSFSRRHPRLGPALWIVGGSLAPCAVVALFLYEVTVPLLWPLAATLFAGWLVWCNAMNARDEDRRRAELERAAREREAQPRQALVAYHVQQGGPPWQRIGTDERHAVADALGEHWAAGRLNDDEYASRRDAALVAVTREDLAELLRDF
jgi:hypothetical protein